MNWTFLFPMFSEHFYSEYELLSTDKCKRSKAVTNSTIKYMNTNNKYISQIRIFIILVL